MVVDEIFRSSERVGLFDEKLLMCIFYFQYGSLKVVNIVDVVGGLEGGGGGLQFIDYIVVYFLYVLV